LINTEQWIADNQLWIDQLPEDTQATIRLHEAAGTTEDPDYRAAEKEFYARHMCRRDPCPNQEFKANGPLWNKQMYETMWGPTEFFAPGRLKNYDVSARLENISVPTLMICGEYDEAAPKSCHRYANMVDGAETVIIPDAGHATMAENEDLYMETVRTFLEGRLGQ
jgi:proline iminopeptidase